MFLKTITSSIAALLSTQCFGMHYNDDFSQRTTTWNLGTGWSFQSPSAGVHQLRGNNPSDTLAWKTNWCLDTSWIIDTAISFQQHLADSGSSGTASIALSAARTSPGVRLLANIQHHNSGAVLITIDWFDGTKWNQRLSSGWLASGQSDFRLRLQRPFDSNNLQIVVATANGFAYKGTSEPIPAPLLDSLSTPGFRVFGASVEFGNLAIVTPAMPPSELASHHQLLAKLALNDLLTRFWSGSPSSGHIINTWHGYSTNLPQARGALWERATMYFALENYWRLTGDLPTAQRLRADWARTTNSYTAQELEACGQDSGTNWASDDAGWSALMYLAAFRATEDPSALARARGIVSNAFARWVDDQLGGGMWYSDERKVKSLYQAALLIASLRIHELAGDQSFLEKCLQCYTWIERHLLRSDGLYWADYGHAGPIGAERPDDIQEAGSVSFFGGNQAMGVLHAQLYRLTGEDVYRQRALRTADALLAKLADSNLVYINDRDAWTDGTFAGEWAREVLTLPGCSARHLNVLRATANSIYTKARTSDGYFGGSWSGPAEGADSAWFRIGSKPQQIMTSANSVNMIVAAGFVESFQISHTPPQLSADRDSTAVKLTVRGDRGLDYRLDASTNLSAWQPFKRLLVLGTSAIEQALVTNSATFFRAELEAP